jgi:hypothetical protein
VAQLRVEAKIQLDARLDESGFLDAFDSNRDLICAAAKVYVRGSRVFETGACISVLVMKEAGN